MPRRGDEVRTYAEEHLAYEVEMVAGLVARFDRFDELLKALDAATDDPLGREVVDVAGRNADIESFAVHVRNLIDFLYGAKKPRTCVARDYFQDTGTWSDIRPEKTRLLRGLPQRLGVEVVHLSYDRQQPAPPWTYHAIWRDLAAALRVFAARAEARYLSDEARARIATQLPRTATAGLEQTMDEHRARTLTELARATQAPHLEAVVGPGTATIPLTWRSGDDWAGGDPNAER